MKQKMALLFALVALVLTACSSDPQWADPEAHEKTVELNEQYGPLMAGTWHYEKIGERQRYFERLTFNEDGTFTRVMGTGTLVHFLGSMNLSPMIPNRPIWFVDDPIWFVDTSFCISNTQQLLKITSISTLFFQKPCTIQINALPL